MKYGLLSHGIVDVDQPRAFKISDGVDGNAPQLPKEGDVRYNHDRVAEGLGANSGKGQYEIYRNGNWTTLLTEMDLTSDKDVKNKTKVSDNVIFKLIADSLKDTFISAIGSLSLVQQGSFGNRGGPGSNSPANQSYWPGNSLSYGNTTPQSGMENQSGKRVLPGYMKNVQWSGTHGASWVKAVEGRTQGNNLTGVFKSYIGNGRLYSVDVESSGSGYDPTKPPQLLLDTRGGRGAVLVPVVTSGVVSSVNVLSGGTGYRSGKSLVIEKGSRARKYAKYEIVGEDDGSGSGTWTIKHINVIDGGGGYETLPDVFISDGGHSAVIEPIMGTGQDQDKITDVVVKASGFDFSVTPDVIIKSEKLPVEDAVLKCNVGNNRLLAIKLMKPVPSNFLSNGNIPLTISGGGSSKPAVAHMVISNGVGTHVVITDPGTGYTSNPHVELPASFFKPTTDVSVFGYGVPNHRLEFEFNIFKACGVDLTKKHLYDITLFNNLSGTYPLLSPYANQTVRMMAEFRPLWSPFTNFNHGNYGKYHCVIELFGQKHYYSSAVTSNWLGQVTKSRGE
ncbi:hypothetical protein CMK18_21135 [Candidatus Poribacteria bacterium]|nr:hypothetical protein [Candidatus Poribacteria bacterium]